MYDTLITSVFNETETFVNETIVDNPGVVGEHISSETEDDYPYSQQEQFEDWTVNGMSLVALTYFPTRVSTRLNSLNANAVQRSGLAFADIRTALERKVNFSGIRHSLELHNQNYANDTYLIDTSGKSVDAVFTEAVHQFQILNYIDPKEHDGILGVSTLDTLELFNHSLRPKLASTGFYGQNVLNNIKSTVASETNNEFTTANWFENIMRPAWLGIKIHDGVHLLLLRKLREAEQWLLKQTQYKGMTPAVLGKALGFNPQSRFSASRLSSGNQAMHGFGLAIDINVPGNPWIGAGWTNADNPERVRMIEALRNASGDKSLPGKTIFSYLHNISQSHGNDTASLYRVLKQRNDEFISYLSNNSVELSYWKSSYTFDNRNPLNGFLNLHPDLVYALRQVAGLAWGAVDFGPGASGDIMHFDNRTIGFGKTLCKKIGGFVPSAGHPAISNEIADEENEISLFELHEAINEGEIE